MTDIGIGQTVLINGTNLKRKVAEGIPINARAVVYLISHAPNRPTIYNVEVIGSGHKHGLYLKEFKALEATAPAPAEAPETPGEDVQGIEDTEPTNEEDAETADPSIYR